MNDKIFTCITAHKLVKENDFIAVKDLNIKGLAQTNLAKSILDVAWGNFITILEAVAVKCGVWLMKVNPYGTTQDCSGCGVKVPKDLSVRTHECHKCGLELDRDINASVNILERGLKAVGLIATACGGLQSLATRHVDSLVMSDEAGNPKTRVGEAPPIPRLLGGEDVTKRTGCPNKAAAPNPAVASQLHSKHHQCGVAEPRRYAAA